MQKQCFEFLTSQGPKAKNSFSVLCTNNGTPAEVPREFDAELNGNCFRLLHGQRMNLPPKPSNQSNPYGGAGADTQGSAATRGSNKSVSPGGIGSASLNGPYAFLVLQVFLPTGEPFQIEITLRDKQNHKRRIILSDSVHEFPSLWGFTTQQSASNQSHQQTPQQQTQAVARVPTAGCLQRDQWLNLCIDVNSFVSECFRPRPYPNPAHNNNSAEKTQKSYHATHGHQQDTNSSIPHGVRQIESLTIEGPNVKIRKILNCKFQLPQEQSDQSGLEEVFDNGVRVENLPKQMNFLPDTQKINQIVTADLVKALAAAEHQRNMNTVEDSMTLTSNLKMMPFNTTHTNGAAHTQTELNGHQVPQVSPVPIRELTTLEKPCVKLNDEHNAPQFYLGTDSSQIQYSHNNKNALTNRRDSSQNSQDQEHEQNQDHDNENENEVDVNKTEKTNQSELRILPQITSSSIAPAQKTMNSSSNNATPLPNNQQHHLLRVGNHQGQNQQAFNSGNQMGGGVTSESMFKLASSTKTSAIVKHTNQSLSTAYSVRTTSSGKQQQPLSNLANMPPIGVVGHAANNTTTGSGTKPGLQSSLSPFSSSLYQQKANQRNGHMNGDPQQVYTQQPNPGSAKQQINFAMRKHSVNSRSNGQFEPVEEFVPGKANASKRSQKTNKNASKPPVGQKQQMIKQLQQQEIETALTSTGAVNNPWGSPGSSPVNFNSSTGKTRSGTKKIDGLSNKAQQSTAGGANGSKATIYLKNGNGTSSSMRGDDGSGSKNSNWNSQANLHASEILTNNTTTPKPIQKLQDVHEVIPILEENETIRASVDKHVTSKLSNNVSQSTPASLLVTKTQDQPPKAKIKKQGNHTDLKKLQEEVQESKANVKRIAAGYKGNVKRRPAPSANQLHQPQASAPPASTSNNTNQQTGEPKSHQQNSNHYGSQIQTPSQQPKSSGAVGHPRFSEGVSEQQQKKGKLINKRPNVSQNNTGGQQVPQMGNSFANLDESMMAGVRGNSCANINDNKRIGNGLTNTGRHANGVQKLQNKGSAAKQNPRRVGFGSTSDNGLGHTGPQQPYQSQYGARSYEDEQSDFKTTTLRFTNNNFIIDAPSHLLQNTTLVNENRLTGINGGVQNPNVNHPFSPKRKGQSDLRNMSQSSSFMHNNNLTGQQQANISGALQGNVTTTAGLNLRNMHDQMLSLQEEQQDDEEDMIEEEINEQNESPLPVQNLHGKKNPENFVNMQPPALPANFLDQSERVVDHQIYGMPIGRQQLQQINTDKDPHHYYAGYVSPSGAHSPERQAIIEEDIHAINDTQDNNPVHDDTTRGAVEMKTMTETFTSEFYQAPVQGGIPVRLKVESRRPFTPPFAQLFTRVNADPNEMKQHQMFTEVKISQEDPVQSPAFPKTKFDEQEVIEEQIVGHELEYPPHKNLDDDQGAIAPKNYEDQGETTDVTKTTPNCSEHPQRSEASGVAKTDAPLAVGQGLPNFSRNGLGLKLSKGNASAEGLLDEEYLAEQQSNRKAKLIYDKSLRAYYNPETQEYFEMM